MVALIAAGTALVLGYVGYRAVPHNAYSPTDAVYWSISLFAERVGPTPGGTPVAVDIGRFLALGVIAYAAFAAAALALRDRTDAWRVRHFARRHVIVAGTGSAASAAVDALRSAADDVVVIDAEPGSREGLGDACCWCAGHRRRCDTAVDRRGRARWHGETGDRDHR